MRIARLVAAALLLASFGAPAALCDGPCSITMDFANGGSITTVGGATLTFGTGGALVLGSGGTITPGTGGSIAPAVDPPDMSAGGTVVLGPGGAIQFGTGGSLDSGADGGIDVTGGDLAVAGAESVTVNAANSVHLGDLNAGGTASITAAGDIDGNDTSTPIDMDTTAGITVVSDTNVTYSSVAGSPVELASGSGSGSGSGAFCTSSCPAGGTSTLGSPTIPTEAGFPSTANAGAFGLLALLPLVLLGLRRRR